HANWGADSVLWSNGGPQSRPRVNDHWPQHNGARYPRRWREVSLLDNRRARGARRGGRGGAGALAAECPRVMPLGQIRCASTATLCRRTGGVDGTVVQYVTTNDRGTVTQHLLPVGPVSACPSLPRVAFSDKHLGP